MSWTQTFWIAAGAVAVTLIAGFGFAGWVTGGTAQEMATSAAAEARHELAAAVCVEDFMKAADSGKRLQSVKDATWYERDKLVLAGGFATMPDRSEPDSIVASMCAAQLAELEMKTASAEQ